MAVMNLLRLAWPWLVNIFLEIVWFSPLLSVICCLPSWSYILVHLELEWLLGSFLCLVSCLRLLSERIGQTQPTEELLCEVSPVIGPVQQRRPLWGIRVLCVLLCTSLICLTVSLIRSYTWFLPVSQGYEAVSFTPVFHMGSAISGVNVFCLLTYLRVLTNFKKLSRRRFGFQVHKLSSLSRVWGVRRYLLGAVSFGMLATGILLITNTGLELSIPRDVVMWWILHGFVSLYSLYADFVFTHRTVLSELCKEVMNIRHSKQSTSYTMLKDFVNLYLKCSLLNTSFVLFLLTYFWEELHCELAICTACLMLVCFVQTGLDGAWNEKRIQNLKNYLVKAVSLTVEDGEDETVTVTFNPLANDEEELLIVNGVASLNVAVLGDDGDEDIEEHICLERNLLIDRFIRIIFPELKLLDVEKKPYTFLETSEKSDSRKTIP